MISNNVEHIFLVTYIFAVKYLILPFHISPIYDDCQSQKAKGLANYGYPNVSQMIDVIVDVRMKYGRDVWIAV